MSLQHHELDEKSILQIRDRHLFMLRISFFVILCAFVLQVGNGGHVRSSWLPNFPFPVLCGSKLFFGVECPGCGLTRSFVSLAHGDIAGSLAFHRVGWILALAVVAQIPYRIYRLREMRTRIDQSKWPIWFGRLLISALILNWLIGLLLK